jgi:hypothetical protein
MTSNVYQVPSGPDLVSHARRNARALAFAARINDETAWMVSATRLRMSLARATAALGKKGTIQGMVAATQLYALTIETRTLRDTSPSIISGGNSERVIQWSASKTSLGTSGAHADLFDLDAVERGLPLSMLSDLFILQARMIRANMLSSCFENAVLDECDLSCANLQSTHWNAAQVSASQLSGCDLTDATIDFATFIDCDLRTANLSAIRRTGAEASANVMFIRCDLRNTLWDRRRLANVVLMDCRVHQMHGRPTVDSITIVRPDLSAAGDGSRIGSAAEVLALWGATPHTATCLSELDLPFDVDATGRL